jgi:ribose 5-phosphate isomerase A
MNSEQIKKAVGYRAADFIQDGMIVGLGTGSTAQYFIEKLIERVKKEKIRIRAVASSLRSLEQAKNGGIPIIDINSIESIDITVDGADEIDSKKRMIKVGGGALLREKIVASMSKEMIVIIDESKVVPRLGHRKLPVEVVPFAHKASLYKLAKLGYQGEFRQNENKNGFYVTDNGNYIIDIVFPNPLTEPEKDHEAIKQLPGVVETGFFFHLAGRVIVGFSDGQVIVRP